MPETTEKRPLVVPQINLNGTSGRELVAQQAAVLQGLTEAMDALAMARPHGRDYQTMPTGTYEAARAQNDDWMARLNAIRDEVFALANAIHDQRRD